jgi:O-succinylbenzoate synthase
MLAVTVNWVDPEGVPGVVVADLLELQPVAKKPNVQISVMQRSGVGRRRRTQQTANKGSRASA